MASTSSNPNYFGQIIQRQCTIKRLRGKVNARRGKEERSRIYSNHYKAGAGDNRFKLSKVRRLLIDPETRSVLKFKGTLIVGDGRSKRLSMIFSKHSWISYMCCMVYISFTDIVASYAV